MLHIFKLQEDEDMFNDEEYQKFLQEYHSQEVQPGVVVSTTLITVVIKSTK